VVSLTFWPFNPQEKSPVINWIGGWVDSRAGLDDIEKWKSLTIPVLELLSLRHSTRR
jgi:hypothetical protein